MQLPLAESDRAHFISMMNISIFYLLLFSLEHSHLFQTEMWVFFFFKFNYKTNKQKKPIVNFFFNHFLHLTGVWDHKFHCIKCPSRTRPDVFMFTTHYLGIAFQNKVSPGKSECECFHASGLQCLCWSRLFETMWF